jgi:2-dehydropantoate 2-reductase
MTSVAVVGVGAIGGTVVARLAEAESCQVLACVRTPIPELAVQGVSGLELRPQVRQETEADKVSVVDWVLLATKAHQTRAAAAWLAALTGPSTRIAVLQNGVEHQERVAPLVAGRVVPVIVDFPAEPLGQGRIRLHGDPRLLVADDSDGREFAQLMTEGGIATDLTPDFLTASWRKLCQNVAGGAITALTCQRMPVLREPQIAGLGLALIEEARDIGRALGALLPDDLPTAILTRLQASPPESGSSMLWDRLAGRPLEYDARNGAVVRGSDRTGIPAPCNRTVNALLAAVSGLPARDRDAQLITRTV